MMPRGSLTFIGTATCLLRIGSFTVLTDPNFLHRGERAYLGRGLWSKRLTEPALSTAELPRLDAVLLSHLHGDHWDRVARAELDHAYPVITTTHAAPRLKAQGFSASIGLSTWQQHSLAHGDGSTLTVTSLPGQHAKGLLRHVLPPVMGSMLEHRNGSGRVDLRTYITGDTLLIPELAEIPGRYPEIDTAVLHLGGTKLPGGFTVTMDGEAGATMMQLLPGGTAGIPVHLADYSVFRSPLADFTDSMERRGLADRIRLVAPGETVALTATSTIEVD